MKSNYFNAMALSFMLCLLFSIKLNAQTAATDSIKARDTIVVVKVSGITCGGDLPLICERVKKEKGVMNCQAVSKPAATTSFEVKYDPALITYQQVVAAIEDATSCDNPNQKPYKVKRNK